MKAIRRITAVALLALVMASASLAQGQMGGQFQQFREQHKYTFQLMQMVHHIGMIDQDAKHKLTPAQAKQVLAVVKPLTTKPKLTQEQAKDALKNLKKIFTVDQLNAMARIKPPARRMGSGGPGGPGGPGAQGGPRGMQGKRPSFNLAAMKDFNPFYAKASKSDPMAADRAKRMNQMLNDLGKKAKAAPAKAKAKK